MFEEIQISFQTKEPIYYQVEEQLKFMIPSGKLKSG